MKRLVPALVVPAALGGLAWYWLAAGGRTDRPPDEPFAPSQQPGVAVPAAEYHLSGPYTHSNLAVFLVHGPETLPGHTFLTLQEALEQKAAVVHETGSVGELAVENLSGDADLFVQSGDIVKGGKQDRTLPYDTIVGPQSGQVPINSFCVEQGRWTKRGEESSAYFSSSSSNLATNELKRAAYEPGQASQAAVWSNVAKTQGRLEKKVGKSVRGEASESSLQLTMENPAVRDALAPYQAALSPVPGKHPDAIGCVVAVNGNVLSADVYGSRTLFAKLWPKLLAAGATEAFLEADAGRPAAEVTKEGVRAFLSEGELGAPAFQGVTERTYVHVRRAEKVMLFESCDRARDNLVLHRSFLAR